MPPRKKAAAKPAAKKDTTNSIRAAVEASRTNDVTPVEFGPGAEPHEINSALASPRMRALLEDQRASGGRPPKGG